MSKFELKLPRMGESVAEATLTVWLKEVGDFVELDEPICEIATDKVDSEVPSEVEGILTERRFEVDDVVKVGETIAVIEPSKSGSEAETKEDALHDNRPVASESQNGDAAAVERTIRMARDIVSSPTLQDGTKAPAGAVSSERFYSPLVKNIASKEGISMAELNGIKGTGKEGRVTKNDILHYVNVRGNGENEMVGSLKPAPTSGSARQSPTRSAPVTDQTDTPVEAKVESYMAEYADKSPHVATASSPVNGLAQMSESSESEVIPMTRMGKLIAKHMVESVATSAHVQSFIEVDVTALVDWRNKMKDGFQKREGEKLTFTPIFMEAVAKALKKYPMMNISVEGDNVIKKKNINIGMATALPDGNLIVPVIKNADRLNLVGMAQTVNDLALRARENRLKPDEVRDGTYTVTNVGTFGSVFGTPIINQPQVGILALGAIRKIPSVIETPSGDFIGIRSKMFLSHSYDHRVVNGALGSMFVKSVADYLEAWDSEREV